MISGCDSGREKKITEDRVRGVFQLHLHACEKTRGRNYAVSTLKYL